MALASLDLRPIGQGCEASSDADVASAGDRGVISAAARAAGFYRLSIQLRLRHVGIRGDRDELALAGGALTVPDSDLDVGSGYQARGLAAGAPQSLGASWQAALLGTMDITASWLWPALLLVSGLVAGMLLFHLGALLQPALTQVQQWCIQAQGALAAAWAPALPSLRPALALWFLTVCPGMAIVRLLPIRGATLEWVLAVGLSAVLDGTLLAVGHFSHLWSVPVVIASGIVISAAGAAAQLGLLARRRHGRAAGIAGWVKAA